MLLTDDSCWASSSPSRRKEGSRFAPDGAHKGFQAAGPGIQLKPREARESHLEGQAQPKELLLSMTTSPWNQPTLMQHFVNEDSRGACELSLTADACLPVCLTPLTPFKQIIIFWDFPLSEGHVPMISIRQPLTFQRWQIGNHPDVRLQLHQKPTPDRKMCDLHLAWRKITAELQSVFPGSCVDARVLDGLQMMSGKSLQTLDKLPSLILLVSDLETDVGSLHIMRGHRLWANVFSIEPRSVRASWFTSGLKWLFRECHKWEGQGSSFQKPSLGQTGHP